MSQAVLDPKWFRQVLGQYPTGVCVITAMRADGTPAAMVVGSFTSVSLNPPLVAFLPDRNSRSWAALRECGHFCVNILAADQEQICRDLASSQPDKFNGIDFRYSPRGAPIIDGVVAWIDCETHAIHDAGDHQIVIGAVTEMGIGSAGLPLLFFQGGYGRFQTSSLAASDPNGAMTEQLLVVDVARGEMERLAREFNARCLAVARLDDGLVIVASAGEIKPDSLPSPVGLRFPFVTKASALFLAWADPGTLEKVFSGLTSDERADLRARLDLVQHRGFSLGMASDALDQFSSSLQKAAKARLPLAGDHARQLLQEHSFDPPDLATATLEAVRLVSAPIFDPGGEVVLEITLSDFRPIAAEVTACIDGTLAAARRITERLGGSAPVN